LGLQPGATEEEIRTAFLRLVKSSHPDRGGERDEVEEVIAARDSALASVKPSAVEPLQIISELVKVMQADRAEDANRRDAEVARQEQAERRSEAREESRRVSSQIAFTHGARYRELARVAGIMAAASVGIAVLSANSWLAVFPYSAPILTVLGIILGIAAWKTNRNAEDVKLHVDNLSEAMTERAFYTDLLLDVLPYCGKAPWDRSNLIRGVYRWIEASADLQAEHDAYLEDDDDYPPYWPSSYYRFRKLRLLRVWWAYYNVASFFRGFRAKAPWEVARMIGGSDFQRLLVAKGLEHGIILELEIEPSHETRQSVKYLLESAGEDFVPRPSPRHPQPQRRRK
jgi:hypothetical protein